MWSKLSLRVISAIVGIVLVLACIFTSTVIFNIAVSAASLMVLYELSRAMGHTKKWQLMILSFGFAVIILSSLFVGTKIFKTGDFTFIMVLYLALLCVCGIIWHDTIKLSDITESFFILIYGVVLIYHLALIREGKNGVILVFLPFLGAFATDTFAYFSGKIFGRHKLIPKISPNKTIEGSIGGIAGSLISFYIFAFVVRAHGATVNYVLLTLLALCCGCAAQFGDLTASLIKRQCHAKDFGNIMPGHGGMLDRIDSLIFVAPLVYYFLHVFEAVYI